MKRFGKGAGSVLAIAAFGAMGAAHGYEWQVNEDTMFGIGGDVELAYVHTDKGSESERELEDVGSEIDFYGNHAFTNSLSAYFSAEFKFPFDETEDSPFSTKEVVFGLRGNFGAVQIGDWDGIYEDSVEDFLLLDVMEVDDITVTEDFRTAEVGNAIAYFSPALNGLSFAVQGFFVGEDNDPNTVDGQAFQAVVTYEIEPFEFHLAYDNNDLDDGADGTIGLVAGVDLSPITLAAKVESVGEDSSPTDGAMDKEGFMLYGVGASYDYGPGAINALVQRVEPEANHLDSRTELGVNVNYSIADNYYVFIEHIRYDQDNGSGNTSAIGMVYEF